jgi:Protein of unknown function (DUF1091)
MVVSTFKVFNDSQDNSKFNLSFVFPEDFAKLKVSISLVTQENGKQEYDKVLFDANADSCKIQQGVLASYLTQVVTQTISKFSNLSFTCPQKKGFVAISNFNLNDISALPKMISSSRQGKGRLWVFTFGVKGKDVKVKSLVNVTTLKFYGSTIF